MFCLIATAKPAQSAPQDKKESSAAIAGQIFEQQTKLYGKCTLLATASGIKLTIEDKQMVLASCAPKWQLLLYNVRQKKYFQTDPEKWRAPASMTVALYRGGDSRNLTMQSPQKTELKGIKCTLYKLTGKIEPVDPKAKHHWTEFSLRAGQYWTLPDSRLPEQAVQVVQKMYTSPKAPGLPLQLNTVNQRQSVSDEIVLSAVRNVTVSASEFAIPAGYQPASEQGQLWLDDRTEGVQDLIN